MDSAGDEEDQRGPDRAALAWIADTMGCRDVTVVRGLREGGAPWLLLAGGEQVVLREAAPEYAAAVDTEVAALLLAERAGIPAPRLLGVDTAAGTGDASGRLLLLVGWLEGSSRIPLRPDPARLRAIGAAAARLHEVALQPSGPLPARERPIELCDFAALRREAGASDLFLEAEEIVAARRPAGSERVFVHGDFWHGNTLWDGGTVSAVIDWDCAGAGDPGVDLGSLRCDAAVCFGQDACADVVAGWEVEAGRPARDVAYWDVVAALSTPPDMGWFVETFWDQGRPDLDRPTLVGRRDAFITAALDELRQHG